MSQNLLENGNKRTDSHRCCEECLRSRFPSIESSASILELQKDGTAKLSFQMRDDLVGNFLRGILHGGVISSSLDVVGGLVAFVAFLDAKPGAIV